MEEFIKNVINVDVDGLKGVNKYTIKAMYNVQHEGNFVSIEFKLIDEFEMTWKEIDEYGGIAEVNKKLNEHYGGLENEIN